jgi:hypothetical protein
LKTRSSLLLMNRRSGPVTVINRRHKFIFLKSKKTAGTAVEAHLLSQSPLGGDIWHTSRRIRKYSLPVSRKHVVFGSLAGRLFTAPVIQPLRKSWPRQLRLRKHHDAASLAQRLGSFWDGAVVATTVRNPWDIMVSAWQWRRDGRGGKAPPITAGFDEWAGACLSGDVGWRDRVKAYDAQNLMHPFVFINGKLAVDILVRQEDINEGFRELGARLGISIGLLKIRENQSNRQRDYRDYYTDDLAQAVGRHFADIVTLCGYTFDP